MVPVVGRIFVVHQHLVVGRPFLLFYIHIAESFAG